MPIGLLRVLLRRTFPGLRGRRETAVWTLMIALAVGVAAAWDHQQLHETVGTPEKAVGHKDTAAKPGTPRVVPDARTTAHAVDPAHVSAPTAEYHNGTLLEVRNLSADEGNEMCQPDSSP